MSANLPTTYRFTSDPLPATLLSDIKGLSSLDTQQLSELYNIAHSYLTSSNTQQPTQPTQSDHLLTTFSTQHSVTEPRLRTLLSALLYVLSAAIHKTLSADTLADDLTRLNLTTTAAHTLAQHYRTHTQAYQQHVVDSAVLSVNELVDFQWRFGVTAASSALDGKAAGSTWLQLTLVVDKGDGVRRNVRMELSLPQFYDFLQQMQSASRQVEKMSQAS